MSSKDLSTKYYVGSEELQTAKFKMYASVAMVKILSYQQVIKCIVITWRHIVTPLNAKVIEVSF